MRFTPDDRQRSDELTIEFRHAIEREIAHDPANPIHTYIIMRALVRVLAPCLMAASRAERDFWVREINRAYGVFERD